MSFVERFTILCPYLGELLEVSLFIASVHFVFFQRNLCILL